MASQTEDTRLHVLGDMVMITGTFTDGGTEVVLLTNLPQTRWRAHYIPHRNRCSNKYGSRSRPRCYCIDCGHCGRKSGIHLGQTLYDLDTPARLGVITAIGSATGITVGGGIAAGVVDDTNLAVRGASKPSITLKSTSVDVSIDEDNSLVLFEVGKTSATADTTSVDGRWWILGKR